MSALQILGLALLVAPIAVMFAYTVADCGFYESVAMWGAAVLVTAVVVLGALLMTGALA